MMPYFCLVAFNPQIPSNETSVHVNFEDSEV